MDYGRCWTVIAHYTDEKTETGKVQRYVGWLVDERTTAQDLRNRTGSDARDIVILANTRVMTIRLAASKALKLRDALKMARGNMSTAAPAQIFPREEFVGFEVGVPAPDSVRVMGDLTFACLTLTGGRRFTLMLDPGVQQDYGDALGRYLAGGDA